MNAKSNLPEELPSSDHDTELLVAMFDDMLADDEFHALTERLRNEPALRRKMLLLAGDEETLRAWATSANSPEAMRSWAIQASSLEAIKALATRRRHPLRLIAAAVAVVAGVVAVAVLWHRPANEVLPTVATITRSIHPEWVGEVSADARTQLLPGQQIELASGQIEITYNTGVRVWLEGPVSAQLPSNRSIRVNRGRLAVDVNGATAKAPPSGEKFAVLTPSARVTDLGTRFALAVSDESKIDLVVYEGAVRTESLAAKTPIPIESTAGQAVRIDLEKEAATPVGQLESEFAGLKQRLYEKTLTAAADHYVRGGEYRNDVDRSREGPRGGILLVKWHRSFNTVRKAWIRFDLAGVDYDSAAPATFVLRHCEPNEERDFRGTVGVFALRPGYQPSPQEQGLAWNEDVLTWENAPGNDRLGRLVNEDHFLLMGEVEIDATSPREPRGTAYEASTATLRNVLQEDDSVTIVLCVIRQEGPSPNLSIAAIGNQDIAGPELIVSLTRP